MKVLKSILTNLMAVGLSAATLISLASAQEVLIAEIEFHTTGKGDSLVAQPFGDLLANMASVQINSLDERELASLLKRVVESGGTITIGKKSVMRDEVASCRSEELLDLVNDEKDRKITYFKQKDRFGQPGIKDGIAVDGDLNYTYVKTYDVKGIRGFTVDQGVSVEQQCNFDPTCVQEGEAFGNVFKRPNQKKVTKCMGAELSDPELIASISAQIQSVAEKKSKISALAWNYGKYVTTNNTLDDLAVNLDRQDAIVRDRIPTEATGTMGALEELATQRLEHGAGTDSSPANYANSNRLNPEGSNKRFRDPNQRQNEYIGSSYRVGLIFNF